MSRHGRGEEGMALLVVMVLMGVMLTTGLALVSRVDTQTSMSKRERVRDSSFNLAESVLNAQTFALARDWPGKGAVTSQYPACSQASVVARCPNNASLVQGGSTDLAGATWTTTVRDNGDSPSENFYSETPNPAQPGYDKNADGKIWVRARAVVQGRPRTLVALVRTEQQEEDIPHSALQAGSLTISNNGNKELIASGGGTVSVRCNPIGNYSGKDCVGHSVTSQSALTSLLNGRLAAQITGTTPLYNQPSGSAMTPEARARLKATAIADGTYYASSCPTAAQLTGHIVYVDATGNCGYTSNSQFNSAAAPGVLILDHASLSLGGTSNFYGVVYAANTLNLNAAMVQTQGNSQVTGGVLIDGADGQFVVGSSGDNIVFDLNAFRSVSSYGSAGVIQNTWREIKAG